MRKFSILSFFLMYCLTVIFFAGQVLCAEKSHLDAILERMPEDASSYIVEAQRNGRLDYLAKNENEVPEEYRDYLKIYTMVSGNGQGDTDGYWSTLGKEWGKEILNNVIDMVKLEYEFWVMDPSDLMYNGFLYSSDFVYTFEDKDLLPYIHETDLRALREINTDIKIEKNCSKDSGLAAYNRSNRNLYVCSDVVKNDLPELIQTDVHHEARHALDCEILAEAGLTSLKQAQMPAFSQGILDAIMEARAYSEEIVFTYNQMKLSEGTSSHEAWEKAYNHSLKEYDFYKPFDEAVKSGKNVDDEPRHLAAIGFFK